MQPWRLQSPSHTVLNETDVKKSNREEGAAPRASEPSRRPTSLSSACWDVPPSARSLAAASRSA